MLIEDIIVYAAGAASVLTAMYFVFRKREVKKEVKREERNWTISPPTSALGFSKMKNSASSTATKGINKKGIMGDKPISKGKAVNWQSTSSFEDDVSKINLDNIMNKKNNSDNERNAFVKKTVSKGYEVKEDNQSNSIKNEYKIKVLLVDDSAVILKKTGDMLRSNDYEVIIKKDGQEAMDFLEEGSNQPDLVVTDMEMPKKTGQDLVEMMRSDNRYIDTPVLVISAHAERHISLMERQMIQGFLKKPFTESDLISQLEYFLNE